MTDRILFQEVAIVGVGLLGGSLGLALKERHLAGRVLGVGRGKDSLAEAVHIGAVDVVSTDILGAVGSADLIVVCTPVRHIAASLPALMAAAKPGAIVTDVGSTKGAIVAAGEASQKPGGCHFVGSHPMAGSEQSGVKWAKADLFDGATCFVTTTDRTSREAFAAVCRLWSAVGSRLVLLRPERHDQLVALVSHLPHIVAVALVRAVERSGEDKNLIRGIIGNGFRDTTRIAHGHPSMWEDILGDNAASIGAAAEHFRAALAELESGGSEATREIRGILEEVNRFRQFLDTASDSP